MCPSGKDKTKRITSQLMNYVPDSYMDRTSRPIYALAYLLLFIVLYEIGTVLVSPQLLSDSFAHSNRRVVISFIWIKEALVFLKFSENVAWFATPMVVVVILLAWQYVSRTSWRVSIKDFGPMTVECLVYAVPLIAMTLFINRHPATQSVLAAISAGSSGSLIADIVTGIGAGIYEELIFRLVLISFIVLFLHDLLGVSDKWSLFLAIFISAILFSAHHHVYFVGGQFKFGEAFSFSTFVFRFLAGGYFAAVFAARGFGIAAGTHAFYDIIVAILNAVFFVE